MDPQRTRRLALWAVLLATAAVRIGYGAITPVLPFYMQEHGLSTLMIAVMTNAYLLSSTMFQGYAGALGDRFGRPPVMLAGIGIYTLAAALFLFDGGAWYYVLLRAMEGLGASAFGPVVRAWVADLVPSSERGQAYARLSAFDTAGILVGPLVGGVAQTLGGDAAPFLVCALLGLVAAVPMAWVARLDPQATAGEKTEAEVAAAAAALAGGQGEVSGWRILRSQAFWAVSLPNVAFAYLMGLFTVIWSLYMDRIGAERWQINLSYTLFGLPMVLLAVPIGKLVDRLGRLRMVLLGGSISTVCTMSYGLLPYPSAMLVFCLVDGLGTALFTPASQAFMADVAPGAIRGKFMGMAGAVFTGFSVVTATLVGYLYERWDPIWLFVLGGAAVAVGCGSAAWLMSRRPIEVMRRGLEGP